MHALRSNICEEIRIGQREMLNCRRAQQRPQTVPRGTLKLGRPFTGLPKWHKVGRLLYFHKDPSFNMGYFQGGSMNCAQTGVQLLGC